MSTRATYSFKQQSEFKYGRSSVTVYVHYDGYPEGAAVYFYEALTGENKRGNLATRFLRHVSVSELTHSHEGHGDTEYRYYIETDKQGRHTLTAQKREGDWNDPKWAVFFSGEVEEFVNQYGSVEYIDNFQPFIKFRVDEYGAERWTTATEIAAARNADRKTLAGWAENGNTESYNFRNVSERVERLTVKLRDLGIEEPENKAAEIALFRSR